MPMFPRVRGREAYWPPLWLVRIAHRGLLGQPSQRGYTQYGTLSYGQRKHHRRWGKWRHRRERRRYRRRRRAAALVSVRQKEVAPSKSISFVERTPTLLVQRIKTTPVSAEGTPDPKPSVQDHLLLVVKAVVNGTHVSALVDSGASRFFISDQLKTHPLLDFIGAYSSLELANGETVVSTGIAPDVLLCIGMAQSRISLTAVPMMEGIQVILGRDWLDIVNPLVDWRANSLVIRSDDELEVIKGVKVENTTQCQITDRGLPGLQRSFTFLRDAPATQPLQDWREQFAQLSSPTFWEYEPSTQ